MLGPDDADDEDVAGAFAHQGFDRGRYQGLVVRGRARDADDVDVVLDGLAGGFLRGLEERADIDVKADIGKGRGYSRALVASICWRLVSSS